MTLTTIIKNGTVVTADLTYTADVAVDGGKIIQIGDNLTGDKTLDATGCYVMPGGIDPHTHLEMPFMGTYSSDDFESGTRAALAGGTTMVVDFALPNPGESLLEALKRWDNKSTRANCDYSFHMAVTWWGEIDSEQTNLRRFFLEVLNGNRAFPVNITNFPGNSNEVDTEKNN